MVIAQGEVWWADIGEPIGSAPGYRRPVVVVQCDAMNRIVGDVVAVQLAKLAGIQPETLKASECPSVVAPERFP
jgi:mRNA-degrading endonuclease toxin of MazEF toxin-antitoxin module